MTKLYAYLLGGALALAGVLGLYAWGRQGHQKAAEATNAARVIATQLDTANESLRLFKRAAAAEQAATASRARVAETQRKEAERRAKRLQEALDFARDWAATPLPDGVYDALAEGGASTDSAAPGPGAVAPAGADTRPARPAQR